MQLHYLVLWVKGCKFIARENGNDLCFVEEHVSEAGSKHPNKSQKTWSWQSCRLDIFGIENPLKSTSHIHRFHVINSRKYYLSLSFNRRNNFFLGNSPVLPYQSFFLSC